MKHLKLFFALFAMLALNVGNAWGADSGITASDGVFVIDFYNSEKLTSTSGSNLSTSNYSDFVKVATGITKSDVVTTISTEGTVRYGMNGGLTVGTSSSNISSVTFNIGSDYAVNKITVYATLYDSGRWLLNGKAADSGSLPKKNTEFSEVTQPLVWDNLNGATTLKFTKDDGNGSNQKRLTIYTIVCEYTTSGGGTEEPVLSATPTEIDFGTVYQGATVEAKTVAVNFSNLTGAVTYNGLEATPFTATGAISATGDKITISADASTIGEYSQTLTITSAADSKTAKVTVKMNVVAAPAPTGTFTLHTGDLIDGDYVVVYDGIAMTNTVSNNRLANTNVTITDNKIVDPLAATIWHIAKSGEYWTIYNEAVNYYAASNGTKNQAQMLEDGTDDKALWTATKNGNAFNFENKYNASNSVNAKLQRNGTYGWACYAAYSDIQLYRKAGTQYNVTVSSTTNGTVTASPTSAEKGATIILTIEPYAGYILDALTVTDASSNPVTVTDNTFTMPESNVTVAATFKANEKPAATLTLSMNGVTENLAGSYKQDDVVTLPSITSDCVKEFVGWSANPTCNVAPKYKAGDSYTLASTEQILYAVYADVTGGETVNIAYSGSTTGNMTGNNDAATLGLDADEWSIISAKGGASNHVGLNKDGEFRLYYSANGGNTLTITAPKTIAVAELDLKVNNNNAWVKVGGNTITPVDGVYTINATEFVIGNAYTESKQVHIFSIDVTLQGDYSNYSTTCAAAPKAEVNPTEITATAAGMVDGKVAVTYENVNTANVSVALFNDAACTETFIADWLTASLDGDKNITYTVAENTTYAERKAYIQLTAPETTGATDPAKVVIPVTQAGKEKVFASLAELVAADLTTGDEVTVTLNNDVIKEFYIYNSNRAGVVFDVQKDGKDIKIYFNNQTTIVDWAVGGKLSGTLTNVKWSTYSSAWQLAPDYNTWAWANLTYTEPKAVSTVVVGGAPTKTTYVDGEAFDPAGLTVTVNYNDATSEVNPTGVTFAVTPATLVKGQTSVSVTATYNSVTSAAYEVTGLTVNDIPTKTVAEFIAAGGVRCYLEGIVSNITNTEYGNFDLTDASGTIYVYGCLNAEGVAQKFDELGVKEGDRIKVVAEEYTYYQSTTHEVINAQYVSHISAATIEIADITMEVGETKNIAATITPADASVTYEIKAGSDDCITLNDAKITATAAGTATITATVAEGETYLGNSVDFTVTVKAPEQALTEWVLTPLADITTNDLVVITMTKEETTWAMTNDNGTSDPDASEVTVTANALAAEPDENLKWVVSNDNGTLTIYPYGGYETWLYCTNANKGVRVGDGDAKEFTINGNYLYTSQTEEARYIGVFDAQDWRCYTSINSNIEGQTLAFFVKKNANDVLPGTGEEPGDDPVVPTPTINPTATFVFNTAEGLNDLGITYPITAVEGTEGAYKTDFEDGASYTQDDITMTTTNGSTPTRVWLNENGLDLRVYKGATLTFSVPAEHQISKIIFDGSNIGHLLVNENAVSGNAWTGSAQTITFTAKSDASTIKINTIAFVVEYTRTVTNGNYGTICLPYGSSNFTGAEFYEVAGKETGKVVLDQVTTLEAGIPYIFKATANELKVVYEGEADDASNKNGLYGTFTNNTSVAEGMYIVNNNQLRKCGTGCIINANRAYLNLDEVTNGVPAQMPGRKRVGMAVTGENGTTDVDNIVTPNGKATKVLHNGQIIIIRNGEKFNAQGQKL